jgi:steroid 5-alpha reductase family enzyme
MRAAHGERFLAVSLFTVFLLQAVLMWSVSLPLQAAARSTAPLSPWDVAGVLLFAAGLLVEALADAQLARFLARPGSRGE